MYKKFHKNHHNYQEAEIYQNPKLPVEDDGITC